MGQPPTRGCDLHLTDSPVGSVVLRLGKAKSLVAVMFNETRCLATGLRITAGGGWCERPLGCPPCVHIDSTWQTLAWLFLIEQGGCSSTSGGYLCWISVVICDAWSYCR